MATCWTPSFQTSRRVDFVAVAIVLLVSSLTHATDARVGAELGGRNCEHKITNSDLRVGYHICVGRPQIVEVGQNTSLVLTWNTQDQNLTNTVVLDVDVEFEHIAQAPPKVTVSIDTVNKLVLTGVKAGKTVVSFQCDGNTTNGSSSCPISPEIFIYLVREVSFVKSLPLFVIAMAVGWIYTIVWVVSYYPQKYYICKRGTVAGLNFNFVGMGFTSAVAYLIFNAGLFWIPEVKNEYFQRHPEGVNPVQLNDVVYSVSSLLSISFWMFQCGIFKREGNNNRIHLVGGLYIGSLWLLMVICVIMGSVRVLTWLDALYIISYITLVTHVVKYIPLVWSNFRRKSTEGFSPYTTILNIIGGAFSVLQMFLITYNFDDWASFFGDPTKFGYGIVTVGFELTHFVQHYFLYRRAWMKKYKLPIECTCDPGCCKCKVTITRRRSSIKVCDTVALPYEKLELKSIVYL